MISETYRMWKLLVLCKNKMEDVHTVVLFFRRGPLKAVRNAGPCSIVACSNNNLYMQVPVKPLKLWYTNPRHIAVPYARISVPRATLLTHVCGDYVTPSWKWTCFYKQTFHSVEWSCFYIFAGLPHFQTCQRYSLPISRCRGPTD